MRATVIKILVFGAFFKNLCHAQTYRSQIRYLEENGGGHQENQVEPVELKTIRTFDQPVVVPQVLNLPMFRYRLLPNPYLYPTRDSLQPRSQYASYPTYTAYYNPSTVLGNVFCNVLREMEKNAKLHVFFWCRFLFWARHTARHFLGLSLLRILFPFLALFMLLYKRQSWDRSRSIYVCVRRELVLSCPWDYVYMTRLFFSFPLPLTFFHTKKLIV